MESQHVRYYLAICDELNFTRAAKKCGITQPSLTTAIQRREQLVSGTLFLRSTRAPHVQLTALGRQLYPICVQMNKLMEDARCLISRGSTIERSRMAPREIPRRRTIQTRSDRGGYSASRD
jgi:DNA-binding transcriptional LysR family regulator